MVNYLFEFGACALDFGEDGFGGGCPDVGFGIGVVGVEVCLDAGDQVGHAAEDSAAQVLVGQVAKPALDLVEPGRRGRGEVQVKPLVPLQPSIDLGVFVGAVVVQDQMDCSPSGTSRSIVLRNLMNSVWRCRGRHWPITLPVSTSRAANKVVVPLRL